MPPIVSKNNRKVLTANRAVVRFGGQAVGLLQNVRASEDFGLQPATGIGDHKPLEHVPTQARIIINVGRMALKSASFQSVGIAPLKSDDVLDGKVFDIELIDDETGTLLRRYEGCSYASGDTEISKHQIIATNAQFHALDMDGSMYAPSTGQLFGMPPGERPITA